MRYLFAFLLTLTSIFTTAQTLQTGEKLSYKVHYGDEDYAFSLKVQQLSPEIAFDYALTSSSFMAGRVKMKKKALQSATKMHNTFSEDDKDLVLENEIAVFPSQSMMEALNSGKEIKIDAGNGAKVFKVGESKKLEIKTIAMQNGMLIEKNISINATALQSGSQSIWISKDLGQPLIVAMDLGWTIQLNTWVSALPLTDKPQDLLGKALSDKALQALTLRLQNAAYITVEEGLSGEPADKEYFCPMEGIRIQTHNDTLTSILFYTENYEHENFKWRAYEGKFACGINLDMTYQTIDKTIGKPTEPRWATDVLIQYPQQRLIVYYNMPDNEKDTKAIANAKINFIEYE